MTPSRFIRSKHLVRGILVALVLLFGLRVGFPFLLQTDAVGKAIEETLEAWTGADVHIGAPPEFSFWPYPRVTLENVRITSPEVNGKSEALASIEAVSATFDLVGAVRGAPVFSDLELVRPTVLVGWSPAGVFNWKHSGWLTQAIDATASAPDGQAIPALPSERLGAITITDGILKVASAGEPKAYRISDINGTVTWPSLRQPMDLSLSGIVNGEMTHWTFGCDQPLALLAGRNANTRTSLSADPATVNFEGMANLSHNAFVAGTMQLSTPSLTQLLAWQGKEISAIGEVGQVNVEAKVTTAGYSAKLENVKLGLDNAEASGVLDINLPPDGVPQIGGTLAFDHIDLKALLTAFSPLPDSKETATPFDTAFLHQFGMDIRLSAKTADFAPFSLQGLAAGMRIENGRASFDVGDSTLLDGRMTGRIALNEQGLRGGAKLQMSLSNVDIGAIVSTLALPGPLPSGHGSADFELSTDQALWTTTVSDMSGQFRLRMGPGTLTHFNRQAFEEMAAKNAFFNFSEAADGSFDFVRADVEARLDRGIAELTKAEIEGNEKLLTLSGMIPYRSASLALAGTLADRPQADATVVNPAVSFFVGGSWPEPVISPVSILTGQQPRQ
ncbi:AsmA family protein [Shinella sp. CPCC 101442]|uniref:AsmA family protein n=1 Tax=Shinella sp. CPCC 101442 TaxID=2932265 RepID=UPI0021529A11|nr:AsmA-like C-terminal region-containing protein [Shinella sp. CPCC 101442]MCR6501098.1 AsmA family protein [Shinella sp. CPCC 101442]